MNILRGDLEVCDRLTDIYLSVMNTLKYTRDKSMSLMMYKKSDLYTPEVLGGLRDKYPEDPIAIAYSIKRMFEDEGVASNTIMFKRTGTPENDICPIRCVIFNGEERVVAGVPVEIEVVESDDKYLVHSILTHNAPVTLIDFLSQLMKWNECGASDIRVDGGLTVVSHLYAKKGNGIFDLLTYFADNLKLSKSIIGTGCADSIIGFGVDDILFDVEEVRSYAKYGMNVDTFLCAAANMLQVLIDHAIQVASIAMTYRDQGNDKLAEDFANILFSPITYEVMHKAWEGVI